MDTQLDFSAPNDIEEWRANLLGRKIVDAHEEGSLSEDKIFRKRMLPSISQVLPPGAPMTRDYIPNRLNVFVDDSYVVNKVYYG